MSKISPKIICNYRKKIMIFNKPINLETDLQDYVQKKRQELQALANWYDDQPHLPHMFIGDLILFMDCENFNIKSSKRRIETYYKMRDKLPEYFSNRDIVNSKELQNIFRTM